MISQFVSFTGKYSTQENDHITKEVCNLVINKKDMIVVAPMLSGCRKLFEEARTRITLSGGIYVDVVETYTDVCKWLYNN